MPDWDVEGQRVFVTGGASGLGYAMANALVGGGAMVAIGGRNADALSRAAERMEPGPSTPVVSVPMDVCDDISVNRARDELLARWGGIDVLINNAGIGMRTVNPEFLSVPLGFWDVPTDRFIAVVDTNLTGYFRVSRAFAPQFISQGRGKIVIISMNHETMKRKGFIPYGPSRAGAESLAYIMAEDLGPFGVTVNILLPGGATNTGMIPDTIPESQRAKLLSPDVMGDPIRFLASRDSDGLTGERLIATEFKTWTPQRRSQAPAPPLTAANDPDERTPGS